MREIIRQFTGRELPMFVTEMGYPSGEDTKLDITQTRALVRGNLLLLGERWRLCYSFCMVDYIHSADIGYGVFYDLNPRRGGYKSVFSPKPAAPAYAAMSFLLEGHRSIGAVDCLLGKSLGYVYEDASGDAVMALWDCGGTPREASIPVGVDKLDVYDWMGNPKSVATPDGTLKLSLTENPVYVKGFSPEFWGSKAPKTIVFQNRRAAASPGRRISAPVTLFAPPGKALSGELRLEGEPDLRAKAVRVDIRPGGSGKFVMDVETDPRAPYGPRQPLATLRNGETMLAAASLQIDVKPPVNVISSVPSVKNGAAFVETTLEEPFGRASSGALKLDIGGTLSSADYSLGAGERRTFSIPVSTIGLPPLWGHIMRLSVAPVDAAPFDVKGRMNFALAKRLSAAPRLTGDLSEWSAVRTHEIKGKSRVVRSAKYFRDERDCSAKIRYAWDSRNLYFAFEVNYRNFIQNQTGCDTWKDACVQLDIDLDPFKRGEESANSLANLGLIHRFTEITFALTRNGPEAYRSESYDKDALPVGLLDSGEIGLSIKRADNPDGSAALLYETAIPWRSLGADKPPAAGDVIGIAAAMNYRNDSKQDDPCAIGVFRLKEQAHFGFLILE
jgi:hypothetical protein